MAESDGSAAKSEPPKASLHRAVTDQGNKSERLLRVDQIYSRKDRQIHFVKTAKAHSKPDRFSKTALVVRRVISQKGMVSHTEIDIRSPLLQEVFQGLYKGVDGLELNKSPPVATPELLFWATDDLLRIKEEEKLKDTPNQQLINDIGTALRFVEEDFHDQISCLNSMVEGNGEITYELLWAIFPPRAIVLAPRFGIMNQEQAFELKGSGYKQRDNGARFFSVSGTLLRTDGRDFGRATVDVEIDQYEGARKISSLDVFPLSRHAEEEAVRKRLFARGKKYLALLDQPACMDYPVPYAVKEATLPNRETKLEKFNARGRVMIDPEGYYLHNSSSKLNDPVAYLQDVVEVKDLPEDQVIFCAPGINGFSFTQKTWCQLAVDELTDVVWNMDAFKRLVMEENRRQLIHGLVKAHRQDDAAFDDIVENKGKGLIALLTGSPGVGKTLTAEAVAEVTKRPLYVVATGELGIDADAVDRQLDMILEITRRWGCVLLIDEADVFLAARGKDLARDALVSVFLRRLEYFRGVAILTTNRKDDLDEAFKSRIHFTVHYPDLDEKSRQEVWKNFLRNVAKTSELSEFTDEHFVALSRHKLNGRQIKNIVSCAVSLAREHKKQITVQDIEGLMQILVN
ncbi:P-loop containing nucleoside triphosphate hydrolase protein [Aspergillus keveii]|uniref:P-loop containing nucleoside triphosphate hydrolase protein n=1 Tax=Aspergillus keveii TaxID=714993 RepID=A0ABR4G880_9EURO